MGMQLLRAKKQQIIQQTLNMNQTTDIDNICGECRQIYSKQCKVLVDCHVHKQKCFSCRKCNAGPITELSRCQGLCGGLCQDAQLYEDFSCYKKLCRFQFLNIDFHSPIIKLPCGCSYQNYEIIDHIIGFISHFCYTCGRTIHKNNPNEINLCKLCSSSNSDHKFNTLGNIKSQQQTKELIKDSYKSSQSLIKSMLQEELSIIQQAILISQYSKFQIKNELDQDNQIQNQCTICTLQYNLIDRKPLMVCLNQHIFCEYCVDHNPLNICPLCKDPIIRHLVQPNYQTLRLINIKNKIKQASSSNGKLVSLYIQSLKEQEKEMLKTISHQIQTAESYLVINAKKKGQLKEVKQINVSKRTKLVILGKQGQKKIKFT